MSVAARHTVTVTTDASGDATGYSPVITGKVHTVAYTKVDYDAGVDFTITVEGTAEGVWTETNVNATTSRAPRQATHDVVGAASLYAAAGEPVEDYIAVSEDRIKIVVAQGGNVKSGTFNILVT